MPAALWPLLLLIAAALVYGAGLAYPLFFDDHEAITDNSSLRALADAWSPPSQTPTAGRPLVNLSFALNYALSGLDPRSYRALNLALHALNAVLAWLLLRALLARAPVPAALRAHAEGCARAISLLWLLHPLVTETVAYLTQRTELLAATFYLTTLVLAERAFASSNERGRVWALGAVAACLLGSLCKETIVSAPLAVLLIDRAFFSASFAAALRARGRMYVGLALTWASIALMLASSPRGQTAGLGLGIGPIEHLATQGGIIAWYLRLAFWPAPLSITYDWPLADPLYRYAAQDALVAALAAATAWLCWRRQWWAALPGVVFFGVLAPSSSIVPVIGELAAERRMYLPLLMLLCVLVCSAAPHVARWPRLAAALVLGLALALGLGARARVHVYRSELSLWQDTLSHQPSNPIAMWGTGDALARLKRYDEALVLYERMAAHAHPYRGPFSWGARGLFAAASVQRKRGHPELARATTLRAFAHAPESPLGTLYRAALLRKQGRRDQAVHVLERAAQQPHLRGAAQLMLSQLYAEGGAPERAQALLQAVSAQGGNTPEARALATQLLSL